MSYFVRIKGKIFGPFEESQLLEMKSKGKITHRTEVSENNQRDWQSADTFTFLFEPVQKASPEPPQPTAAAITDGWFYSTNGKEGHGPVAATEIEQMLQSGQLDGKSYVWQQGKTAGLIKNEPFFASFVSGSAKPSQESAPSASPEPANNTRYSSNQVHDITGTNTQADTGQAYHSDTSSDSRPTGTQWHTATPHFEQMTEKVSILSWLTDFAFRILRPEVVILWVTRITHVILVAVLTVGFIVTCCGCIFLSFANVEESRGISLLLFLLIPILCVGFFFMLIYVRFACEMGIVLFNWLIDTTKLTKAAWIYFENINKRA